MARHLEHTRPLLIFALVGCACSAQPPAPRAPEPPIADERLEEPYLAVRTEFTVILEQPIGTRVAAPASTFSARIRHPIRSPQNEIVIQSGARVRGRVVAIGDKPALNIKIKFDDVDTTWGRAPIGATIRDAEPYATSMSGMDGPVPYDAALFMPSADTPPRLDDVLAVGGGPTVYSDSPTILLPKGAELRLILVRPLVAPPHVRSAR